MASSRPLALITGASAGLGAEFARQLAARGYDLLLVARRADRLDKLKQDLERAPARSVETVAADLATDAGVDAVASRIASAPNLELLVNNAGFGTLGRYFEADAAGQEAMYRLHVLATARLTRAALPGMVAAARGAVINVSSVAGFMQNPTNVSYCSTKCWMNSFTEGLYLELKQMRSPVRVQALCPGFTHTEFHDTMKVDKTAVPAFAWTAASDVVRESLDGLARNRLFVVPGRPYRFLVWLMRVIPRSWLQAFALRAGQSYRRPLQ